MKISQVLLRWHKSFNINYNGYDDRSAQATPRPWNALNLPADGAPDDYGFIEIPLESDITTIVGANESGKSHLLDAVCKVLTGSGNDDRPSSAGEQNFSVTDLCHFSSAGTKDTDTWPNIGLRFSDVLEPDAASVLSAATGAATDNSRIRQIVEDGFVLMLAPTSENPLTTQAYLYHGPQVENRIELDSNRLYAVRQVLPKVRFLRSNLPLVDKIPIQALISAFGGPVTYELYNSNDSHLVMSGVSALSIPPVNTYDAVFNSQVTSLKNQAEQALIAGENAGELEAMLFRDVLNIKPATFDKIASLREESRSYVENRIAEWNAALTDKLNLARYWQQDSSFVLRLDYKGGVLYFEITDKTGSTYTFGERSSGLRYFLSYYIQAKALEIATQQDNNIILMDEPDSFLSTQGQRNLLMVFESLVGADGNKANTQLIYTTHSPWLINRNFPSRIRLVRKGDAEEGTQYIHSPVLRRYEPVRSALGVDCAQTLFMGATNLVLEGATDQYLLTELIRCYATASTLWRYLDLNSLVTVSADSATRIEQILVASTWGDEIQPATVVLLDADEEGHRVRDRITKPRYEWDEIKGEKKKKPSPPLLDESFVVTMAELLGESFHLDDEAQAVVSIEDLVPPELYARATREWMQRWQPDVYKAKIKEIDKRIKAPEFGANGLAVSVSALFEACGLPKKYDKFGVAQELVALMKRRDEDELADLPFEVLELRLQGLCRALQSKIEASEQAQKTTTGQSNVRRLLRDFQKGKSRATVRSVITLFERLGREIESLGDDGDRLQRRVGESLKELGILENARIELLDEELWESWNSYLNSLQKDPLGAPDAPPKRLQVLEETTQSAPDVAANETMENVTE